uniref:Secreted protein n=1 Tax=Phakopsora pachyrhizi TaxID=170000 RepID=A0A0S1MI81_PHAPC
MYRATKCKLLLMVCLVIACQLPHQVLADIKERVNAKASDFKKRAIPFGYPDPELLAKRQIRYGDPGDGYSNFKNNQPQANHPNTGSGLGKSGVSNSPSSSQPAYSGAQTGGSNSAGAQGHGASGGGSVSTGGAQLALLKFLVQREL